MDAALASGGRSEGGGGGHRAHIVVLLLATLLRQRLLPAVIVAGVPVAGAEWGVGVAAGGPTDASAITATAAATAATDTAVAAKVAEAVADGLHATLGRDVHFQVRYGRLLGGTLALTAARVGDYGHRGGAVVLRNLDVKPDGDVNLSKGADTPCRGFPKRAAGGMGGELPAGGRWGGSRRGHDAAARAMAPRSFVKAVAATDALVVYARGTCADDAQVVFCRRPDAQLAATTLFG